MNKNIRLSILIFNDIFLILISTLVALIVRSEKFPQWMLGLSHL